LSDPPIFIDLGVQGANVPLDPDDLRERAATALERASHFIEAHGDALAQSRTASLLEVKPVAETVRRIEERQNADGSFPRLIALPRDAEAEVMRAWDADEGSVGTLQALSMLADLRQLVLPVVDRAVAFVSSRQLEDGSWGSSVASESAEARLIGSAMLTGVLGRTRAVRPDVLGSAASFVAERWAPERVEGAPWGAVAGFASFFANVHDERSDEALQWCGRELERGFRTRRFDALAVLRVLLTSDAVVLPGSQLTPPELLHALLGEQASDGGFAELESAGAGARVEPTLDAALGILRLCAAF
jgi:hypothetical protein